jgi:hypothetical protein
MTRWILKQMTAYARPTLIQYASARDIRRMREWAVWKSMGRKA